MALPLRAILGCQWPFFLRGLVFAVNRLFKRPIRKNADVVTIVVFVALVDKYLVNDSFFCEKRGEDLLNDTIRLDVKSIPNFPIFVILFDE
jgi:hypothetical protein